LVARLDSVDLFCHDSPVSAEHLAFELDTVSKALKPGSVVIADNADMNMEAVYKTAEKLQAKVFPRRTSNLIGFKVPNNST
jgi:predicted O-methyltransferase YrrM